MGANRGKTGGVGYEVVTGVAVGGVCVCVRTPPPLEILKFECVNVYTHTYKRVHNVH